VQTGPDSLTLRLDLPLRQRQVWQRAEGALRRYLAEQGLPAVRIHRDPRPPELDACSGKCRQIVVQQPGGGRRAGGEPLSRGDGDSSLAGNLRMG